eukprot:TRINITY_DN30054_c0_g1_i1.p1 TRINITY_DN30054_c0_g1~~TRINITY_DN30054_c0_g1_i1.p1  ORF type:complete len:143 (-),score=8.19 TRINITY_DN30054_c0_g1_i1:83-511(-)
MVFTLSLPPTASGSGAASPLSTSGRVQLTPRPTTSTAAAVTPRLGNTGPLYMLPRAPRAPSAPGSTRGACQEASSLSSTQRSRGHAGLYFATTYGAEYNWPGTPVGGKTTVFSKKQLNDPYAIKRDATGTRPDNSGVISRAL